MGSCPIITLPEVKKKKDTFFLLLFKLRNTGRIVIDYGKEMTAHKSGKFNVTY